MIFIKAHAFRLTKGQDLKVELENYISEKGIKAAVIASAVGCVSKAVVRNAGGEKCITIDKDLEIVSMTGTFSVDGCHLHISLSDDELNTYGGHLKDGCIINTTCEVVILELENYEFTREMDDSTGYKELVIKEI